MRGKDSKPFAGFARPTYTQVPDQLFDELLPTLSESELKVLLYVVRHTLGWRKDEDSISVSQLAGGITRRDGTVLDRGTGLSRTSIRKATAALVGRGILTVRQVRDAGGEYESNVYALRFAGVGQNAAHPRPDSDRPPGQIPGNGVGQDLAPQQTPVQHTTNNRGGEPDFAAMTPEERLARYEETERRIRQMRRIARIG